MLIDDEADARITQSKHSFRQGYNLQTKLKVYKIVIMTTLLYACETWTVYCRYARILNRFHINCLRKLLRITWQDMIPDTKVFKRARLQSIHILLKKTQLRRICHVVRMSDERLPTRLVYRELSEGSRSTGGQRKRYKDSLKSSLKAFEINNESWKSLTTERGTWRSLIQKGAESYEQTRIRQAEEKRLLHKSFNAQTAIHIFVPESGHIDTCVKQAVVKQSNYFDVDTRLN